MLGVFGLPGSTVLNLTPGVLFDFRKGLLSWFSLKWNSSPFELAGFSF